MRNLYRKRRTILFILFGISVSAIFLKWKPNFEVLSRRRNHSLTGNFYESNKTIADSTTSNSRFLVDTPNCKIPELDPNDPSLRGVVKAGVVMTCTKFQEVFTYDKGNTIFVDWKVVNNSRFKDTFSYCRLTPITRPVTNTSDHDALGYLPPWPKFNDFADTGDHDHFHCKCYDRKDRFLFENYHTIIKKKKEVEDRCKEKMSKRMKTNPDIKENLSVLMILVDTVSRLNSLRFMKKTRNYLLNVLKATDFAGYNKVGYGTFHNLIPAYTGKFYEELPWSFDKPTIFDSYNFIWDDYSNNGFRTYYAEDYPFGALFDYKKPGFRKNPADYFNRHLFLSIYEQPTKIVYNDENCILDKLQTHWVLDPAYKFLKLFKSDPYMCTLILTRLTHDYLERTYSADEIYYNYIKKAHEDGLLNNTVLMFMADHGLRWGKVREWYVGLMEERLPMLYIVLPKWFREKYPHRMKNLQTNSRMLTTPFDFYETLQELLHFTGKERTEGGKSNKGKKRAYSLFNKIPLERSCADAAIESHWCTCAEMEVVDVNSKPVIDAAQYFVHVINKELRNVKDLCEVLSIDKIDTAYKVKPSSKVMVEKLISHVITFTAKPGGAKFEGTIQYDAKTKIFKVESEISRINSIAKEKSCAVNYNEERLCYCKSNRQ